MTDTINHPYLGKIAVSRTRRARRISLTVRTDGTLRLSMPLTVPFADAVAFAESKLEWVERTKAKYSVAAGPKTITMPYSTRRHALVLNPCDTARIKVVVGDGRIRVDYPLEMQYTDEEVQAAIKKGIEEAWRAEAKEYLPARTEAIARELGMRHGAVTVRKTVSKWGSCSSRDDISLSLHLMKLPDHLIDYIIIHELCHTVHKNHGPGFHALLDRLTGGRHRQLRKELRGYHARW